MSWAGLGISEAASPPSADPLFLTLSEVLGRAVAVEWDEAVAVVRAVADGLAASGNASGVPELHQVRLRATGEVDVIAAAAMEEPVRRVGQLLQALITNSDAPVQLRLMITQATAPTPPFASVKEYSDGLAYFERPDRAGVLARLFQRAAAARPLADSAPVPKLDDVAPLPASNQKKSDAAKARKPAASPVAKALAGLALVAIILSGGYLYARRHGVRGPSRARVDRDH